jgi:hypothetical protein
VKRKKLSSGQNERNRDHVSMKSMLTAITLSSGRKSSISRGIGGQFRITQRSALSSLYKNSCCRCKQTISPAEQWYLTCQFKAFVDMQYFLKQFCCLSLIELHMVQGVNNAQKCLITAFSSLTTKLGRCHPNVCTDETGSQLLTATSYSRLKGNVFYNRGIDHL